MNKLSYTILGTGALGGYYGAKLAQSGLETRFVLRSDADHVKQNGLKVDSIDGDFELKNVQAFSANEAVPASDVLVVALKTTHNAILPSVIPSLIHSNSVVLVLENGLKPEQDAIDVVGAHRVLGGLCFLCANKLGPGHIAHLDYGHIDMGACDPGDGSLVAILDQVVLDFNQAGIQTRGVDDLREARWRKLIWNVPYNALSVVLNQTTHELMACQQTRDRIERLMREVASAAFSSEGIEISNAFIEKMLSNTLKMKPYKTSMMLDFEASRPLEIDAIVGQPLRAAQQAGCDVPEMQKLYQQITHAVSMNA